MSVELVVEVAAKLLKYLREKDDRALVRGMAAEVAEISLRLARVEEFLRGMEFRFVEALRAEFRSFVETDLAAWVLVLDVEMHSNKPIADNPVLVTGAAHFFHRVRMIRMYGPSAYHTVVACFPLEISLRRRLGYGEESLKDVIRQYLEYFDEILRGGIKGQPLSQLIQLVQDEIAHISTDLSWSPKRMISSTTGEILESVWYYRNHEREMSWCTGVSHGGKHDPLLDEAGVDFHTYVLGSGSTMGISEQPAVAAPFFEREPKEPKEPRDPNPSPPRPPDRCWQLDFIFFRGVMSDTIESPFSMEVVEGVKRRGPEPGFGWRTLDTGEGSVHAHADRTYRPELHRRNERNRRRIRLKGLLLVLLEAQKNFDSFRAEVDGMDLGVN